MTWRLAKSLIKLREQINDAYPGRSKSSDGSIGDEAHAARQSDHNVNADGVVTAIDITHDPVRGPDARALAETLLLSKDERIKYIISNGQIVSSKVQPWIWRTYTGTNAHKSHVHISVDADPRLYDDARPWIIGDDDIMPARFNDITATVFGGQSDPNNSAYDNHFIDDDEFGVALPARFHGERPKVRVYHAGRSVLCDIVDIGPWNTDDPYWLRGSRPQAESGIDLRGRRTNGAGIDLTPAAARAIGLPGKGKVSWEFVGSYAQLPTSPGEVLPPENPRLEECLRDINAALRPILEKHMAPVPSQQQPDVGDMLRILLSRLADRASEPPATSKLDSIGGDKAIGYKTITGIGGIIAAIYGAKYGAIGPELKDLLMAGFGLLTAVGIAAKIDRGIAVARAAVRLLNKLQQQ